MKVTLTVLITILLVAVIWMTQRDEDRKIVGQILVPTKSEIAVKNIQIPLLPSSEELMEKGLIADSGDAHSEALDLIMECIRLRLVLTSTDRDSMLKFLSEPKPDGIATGQWQERVNEILNLLRAQPGEVSGLASLLVRMSTEDPDPVLRMYALQHIALWIPIEPVEDNKAEMIAHLEKLAANNEDPLSGSAILFLSDLDQVKELPDRIDAAEVIEDAALRLVADNAVRSDVRICALHTIAERKLPRAIMDSRTIAKDPSLMIPLRKAAIYTIGEIGTAEDIALLESLAESNRVLSAATKPAIKRIHSRTQKL